MRILILAFSIFFSLTGCNDDNEKINCIKTIINKELYQNKQANNYTITSLSNYNGCLKIVIRYGGGCKKISVKLVDSGDIFESNPIQRNLKIILDNDNDLCEALIQKTFYFDISNLKIDNENKILLNFQGSKMTYLYKY